MSQQLFTVVALAGGVGCLLTLFVAAHLSWVDKQRRRAGRLEGGAGASVRQDRRRGGGEAAA